MVLERAVANGGRGHPLGRERRQAIVRAGTHVDYVDRGGGQSVFRGLRQRRQRTHGRDQSVPGEHLAGLYIRSDPGQQEAVEADREGNERTGQDHKRLAVAGGVSWHDRAGIEEATRTRSDGLQGFPQVFIFRGEPGKMAHTNIY